jgi:arylsulfatase A-like enzyme
LAALESSDDQFGIVLKALEEKGVLDSTDILVVSDHGFSTVNRTADLLEALKKRKFNVGRQFENPESGDTDRRSGGTRSCMFTNDDGAVMAAIGRLSRELILPGSYSRIHLLRGHRSVRGEVGRDNGT